MPKLRRRGVLQRLLHDRISKRLQRRRQREDRQRQEEEQRRPNEENIREDRDVQRPPMLHPPPRLTAMAEGDFMNATESSANDCFYGRHAPPQPASLYPPPTLNPPLPPNPIKSESPSAQEYPFLSAWQSEDHLKVEEVHEESFETEAPPASPPSTPACASTARPVTTTISNALAAVPIKLEKNAEDERNCTKCLHCNTSFDSKESLSHHVLSVHGRATSDRLCHLCSDISNGMHDDLVREMHMLLKHDLKTFRCSLCGFIEYERAKIARHLSSSHADIGPLTLHKLLSYIERPLCSCNVESWLEYLNSSTKI